MTWHPTCYLIFASFEPCRLNGMVQPEVTVGRVASGPTGKWQITRCYGRNCLREQDFRAFELLATVASHRGKSYRRLLPSTSLY